jgi:hypothetical protein
MVGWIRGVAAGRRRAATEPAASVRRVTGKQRAVLSALAGAQDAHQAEPVSAGQNAALCGGPWHRRSDLLAPALWLLHARGLVLPSAGAAGGWKLTSGRAELLPRHGPDRTSALTGRRGRALRPSVHARAERSSHPLSALMSTGA